MRTIAIANHKGGSAKTTTAVNLAAAIGEQGRRVLLIDMDPQGSASAWLGVAGAPDGVAEAVHGRKSLGELVYESTAPGVVIVPASPDLALSEPDEEIGVALGFIRAIEQLPALWDVVIVDCPPSLGYNSIAPLSACGEVLIPVEAHVLAFAGLVSLTETIERIRARLNPELAVSGVVACRVGRTLHAREVIARLGEHFPTTFLPVVVRENIRLAEAPSFQLPITRYAPTSNGAADYRALAELLVGSDPVTSVRFSGITVQVAPESGPRPSVAERVAERLGGARARTAPAVKRSPANKVGSDH